MPQCHTLLTAITQLPILGMQAALEDIDNAGSTVRGWRARLGPKLNND